MMNINQRKLKPKIGIGIWIILASLVTNLVFTSTQVFAQGERIGMEDLAKLVRLSDARISPDGKQIVLAASRQNLDDNRYDKELVLVDISTGTKRILTYDRPNVGSPRWSPSATGCTRICVRAIFSKHRVSL